MSDKRTLYKTATARIGCALFPAGTIVAVRYLHTSDTETDWYTVTYNGQYTAYPVHHLERFVL